MASFDELVKRKIELFHSTPETLASETDKIQREVWNNLLPLVNDLDTDSTGIIKQSERNLRQISKIVDELRKLLATPEYVDAIKSFLKDIDEGVVLTDKLAQLIKEDFVPDKIQKDILNLAKQNAINGLIGESMVARVTQPFVEQLTSAIATKASLSDTVKSLKIVIEGNKDTDGRMLANVKTIAQTAQAVADRSYAAAVNEAVGAEWYMYRGGEIPTTRKFCEDRNGKYFHRNEVAAWGSQNWDGRIDGTNDKTIFTLAGGWNCRHSIMAVSISRVPKDVIQRNIDNGNYKP